MNTAAQNIPTETTEEKIRRAIGHSTEGCFVFPLAGKTPAHTGWQEEATRDAATIRKMFERDPQLNVGIYTGKFGDGEALLAVDVDNKTGKEGDRTLIEWDLQGFELPETRTHRTPNNGRHLIYRVDNAVKPSASKLGDGVDIRSRGSYVVAYPSQDKTPIADAPAWLVERCNAASVKAHEESKLKESLPGAVSWAEKFLRGAEPAVEGQGGDGRTYATAAMLRARGCCKADALDLMLDIYNPRCSPPWSVEDMTKKVENAFKHGQGAEGEASPVTEFEPVQPLASATPAPRASFPRPLSAGELAAGTYPRPDFLVDRIYLKRHVNLLYGDGGTGKTTLALNLAVATATGKDFLGKPTIQTPVTLILAEDGPGETKARLEQICEHYKTDLASLPIRVWCLPGHDVTVAHVDEDGRLRTPETPFMQELRREIRKGETLILDSMADIAALNEGLRPPVNTFLKRVLGGLCEEFDATIIALAHPSKRAMEDGSGYAGSTAYNNAVRVRTLLERVGESPNRRRFTVPKSNYAPDGRGTELFMLGSVFLEAGSAGAVEQENAERDAVISVAKKMLSQGVRIVRSNGSGQKPKDISAAAKKDHGLNIAPARVLEILNGAERDGILNYVHADNSRRGARAGYVLSETP